MGNKLFDALFLFICFDLLLLDIAVIIIYNMIQSIKNEKNNNYDDNDDTVINKIDVNTSKLNFSNVLARLKKEGNNDTSENDSFMSNYNNDDYIESLKRIKKEDQLKKKVK